MVANVDTSVRCYRSDAVEFATPAIFETVDEGHFIALSSHEGLICTMFVDFVVISTVHD